MSKLHDQMRNVPDGELIDKCRQWVSELCASGGDAWSLRVPVDFTHDPDMLFSELIRRFEKLRTEGEQG